MASEKLSIKALWLKDNLYGYYALITALITGMMFVRVPFHPGYLAVAATIGLAIFLLNFVQRSISSRINLAITVLFLSAASTARGFFLERGSQGYHLAQIQFAVLTLTVFFLLAFLFRKKLVQPDKTTPSSSGAV